MSTKVIHGTDSTFDESVLRSQIPVLVDFWAPWCGPCRMIGPILEDIAGEYDGKVKIVKINVDEETETAGKMNIRSIPTVALYSGGELQETAIGARPKEYFIEMLKKVIG